MKPSFLHRVFLVAIILLGISSPLRADNGSIASGDISIRVNETAIVKNENILLGEIAVIQAPAFLKEGLASLELGRSPKPGKMKQEKGSKVRELILKHELVDPEMHIEVPGRIFIKRDSQEIGDDLLKEETHRYLTGILGKESYEIKRFQVRGLGIYPPGKLTMMVARKGVMDKHGRFSLQLDVIIDEDKKGRLDIKGQVAVYRQVAFAARALKRGESLGDADVRYRSANIFELNGAFLTSVDEVARMALNMNVKMGEALKKNNFKPIPVVKRGEVIKLVARKNRLSIVTLGICRQDGYENQPVMVENLQSGKVVRGLVKQDATVEVIF